MKKYSIVYADPPWNYADKGCQGTMVMPKVSSQNTQKIKYFSMFSGIAGFEVAIHQVLGDNAECVGFSEIDKYATSIYQYHFKENKNYGDATKLITNKIPDFDLLVGGFPCQSFSIAGKRQGFSDSRGTMFFEIARVLSDKRPRYFVLENVKGLLSHENGKTFQKILGILADLNYDVQCQILNTKWFLPQNRERIYFIGHIRGKCRPEIFPITEVSRNINKIQRKTGTERSGIQGGIYEKESNKTGIESGWDGNKRPNTDIMQYPETLGNSQGQRIYSTKGISCQLTAQSGGKGAKTGLYCVATQLFNLGMNGRRQKDEGDPSFTLDSLGSQVVTINSNIRRLTPVECERLQGFPDNWTKFGIMNNEEVLISDNQRYKCLGNAVSVPVVKAVMEKLYYCA